MHIIGLVLGGIMTGLFWWIMFGNGKQAIDMWLDGRNERERQAKSSADGLRAREQEKRAPLKSITDPREAAIAVLAAVAEARGSMTDEQRAEIKAQMRTVLGYESDLDHYLAVGHHAAGRAGSPAIVIDETVPMFLDRLDARERRDVLAMAEAVAALHGGATDAQETLLQRLGGKLGIAA